MPAFGWPGVVRLALALAALMSAQLLDTRSLGKPGLFSGKETEWSQWHSVFTSWTAMLSKEMADEMKLASVQTTPAVTEDVQITERSTQLVHMLVLVATLTKGAPVAIRQHLYLQAAVVGTDYTKARQVIEGHIQAT